MEPFTHRHPLAGFSSKWTLYLSLAYLGFLSFISVSADFLANDRPLICFQSSGYSFPILSQKPFFEASTCEKAIWPPVSHYIRPLENNLPHILGKDRYGRDLLACLIHGTRYSLLVGISSMILAAVLGIIIGGIAGYFFNKLVSFPIRDFIFILIGIILAPYFAFYLTRYAAPHTFEARLVGKMFWFLLTGGILALVRFLLKKIPVRLGSLQVPIGRLATGVIQGMEAMPGLLLLIVLISWLSPSDTQLDVSQRSHLGVIIISLGCLSWTGMARLIRREFIQFKNQPFIESAQALGFSPIRIIFFHILPNCFPLIRVLFLFSIGRAILVESSLSFLGIKPAHYVSWGELLSYESYEILYQSSFYSLALPILLIFLTVLSFFNLSNQSKEFSL